MTKAELILALHDAAQQTHSYNSCVNATPSESGWRAKYPFAACIKEATGL